MTQYSQYTEAMIPTPLMFLSLSESEGVFPDLSGNSYNATAVTVDEDNDSIQLSTDLNVRNAILGAGIYDLFYNSDNTAKTVYINRIGHIYNNCVFCNDVNLILFSEPVTGLGLSSLGSILFGAYDSDAITIITAIGSLSELQKRLIDTHVKDLKAINSIQSNFFKYNDPTNSVLKAIYPFMGNTFDQIKYNWIKAVDEDESFRISLAYGDTSKIMENGVNFDMTFCFDTKFNLLTQLASTNSFSYYSLFDFSDYSNTHSAENRVEMGCRGSSPTKGIKLAIQRDLAAHSICEDTYQLPTKGTQYAETECAKFYLVNKALNTDLRTYRHGVQIGTTTNPGESSYYNGNLIIGGESVDGSVVDTTLSLLPCGYAHIGGGIDVNAIKPFVNAVIKLVSSKNYYYFLPEETGI